MSQTDGQPTAVGEEPQALQAKETEGLVTQTAADPAELKRLRAEETQKKHLEREAAQKADKEEKVKIKEAAKAKREAEIAANRLAKAAKKAANIEKNRIAQEAAAKRKADKAALAATRREADEENQRKKAESCVIVSYDQQSLLDQIKQLAELKSGRQVQKVVMSGIGSSTQVKIDFEDAAGAKAFLNRFGNVEKVTIDICNARPLAGAKRTVHFLVDAPDRPALIATLTTALKANDLAPTIITVKSGSAVIEFASELDASAAIVVLESGVELGDAQKLGEALIGNPPRSRKKRKTTA